jgi:hypothetical protein
VNFGLEGIEALAPDARRTEARQERFERGERGAVEGILTLAPADGVTHEAGLAEHAEMSADRRPAHIEGVRDGSGIPRRLVQHDEDLTSDRIGDGLGDGVHGLQCVTTLLRIFKRKRRVTSLAPARARRERWG